MIFNLNLDISNINKLIKKDINSNIFIKSSNLFSIETIKKLLNDLKVTFINIL